MNNTYILSAHGYYTIGTAIVVADNLEDAARILFEENGEDITDKVIKENIEDLPGFSWEPRGWVVEKVFLSNLEKGYCYNDSYCG